VLLAGLLGSLVARLARVEVLTTTVPVWITAI
jgi:hypothetical protein